MSRELDIQTTDIQCSGDFEISKSGVTSILWESTLNVEQYFGIFLNKNEYIQFETFLHPDGTLTAEYTIMAETPNDPEVVIDVKN